MTSVSTANEAIAGFLPNEAATETLGAALARALCVGDVVFLTGAMGAGKSALARAIIRALLSAENQREEVPSPTYTLMQSYELSAFSLVHADLYRLTGPDEAAEIGLFDDLNRSVWLIEWPERLRGEFPPRRLEIALDIPDDSVGRLLRACAIGEGWRAVKEKLSESLRLFGKG